MRGRAVAVLAAASALASVAAAQGPGATAARSVLDAQVEAWNRGDLEGFMATYWRSPDLVFCSGGTVTRGWDETLARYRKRYQSEGREMGRLRFDGIEVIPLGEGSAASAGAAQATSRTTSARLMLPPDPPRGCRSRTAPRSRRSRRRTRAPSP